MPDSLPLTWRAGGSQPWLPCSSCSRPCGSGARSCSAGLAGGCSVCLRGVRDTEVWPGPGGPDHTAPALSYAFCFPHLQGLCLLNFLSFVLSLNLSFFSFKWWCIASLSWVNFLEIWSINEILLQRELFPLLILLQVMLFQILKERKRNPQEAFKKKDASIFLESLLAVSSASPLWFVKIMIINLDSHYLFSPFLT